MISLCALFFGVLHEIIQIFPWTPGYQLQIRYPGGQWIDPGVELDIRGK